ncbi:MAG: hypothetical protein AABX01_07430 [Candidatus Micrarchaeota archaeon]
MKYWLFLATLGLLLNPVLAECPFLQIEPITSAKVTEGTQAIFAIAIKNNAPGIQNVYISSTNNYLGIAETYFDSSFVALAPNEDAVFNFFASAKAGSYDFPIEASSDLGSSGCFESYVLHLDVGNGEPTVSAETGISASISPPGLRQVFPGTKTTYEITIRNDLGEEIVGSLDAPSNPFGNGVSFSESDFKVLKGQTKIVKAGITLPPGTPAGDFEVVIRLSATSSCCTKEFIFPITLRSISKTADLRLINPPLECIFVKHSQRGQFELGVRNDGELRGPFTLSMAGDADALSSTRLPLRQFELAPGERDYFNLTIFPPQTTPLGIYRFILEAKYLGFLLFQKEFCYEVEGLSNVAVEKPVDASVTRCETDSFKFKVRNIGTLKDEYAIEAKPLVKANSFIEPETFSLAPGEIQIVNYIVQTSCATPVGRQVANVIIRPKTASSISASMPFEVLARDGQGILEIDAPSKINAIVGADKILIINANNPGETDAADSEIGITGISSSWVKIATGKATIKAGKSAPYYVTIKPLSVGSYKLKITAKSGSEITTKEVDLVVEEARRGIDYSYTLQPLKEGTITKSAIITLTIRNTGNSPLTNIGAKADESDLNIVPLDTISQIQPGASATYRLEVKPLKDVLPQDVMLKIFSSEGAATGKPISLPAMNIEEPQKPEEFPWRILIIGFLLIVVFWLLSKQTI